jgi:hypothetical protein
MKMFYEHTLPKFEELAQIVINERRENADKNKP